MYKRNQIFQCFYLCLFQTKQQHKQKLKGLNLIPDRAVVIPIPHRVEGLKITYSYC